MIDENIKEETELVQKMILEFFTEECNEFITDKHLKLVNIIFSRTEVLYDNIEVNGRSMHDTRKIKIKQMLSLNIERVLSFLIHEYSHMFIERNYRFYGKLFPKWVSEGMCDTFSDLVMNYYFRRHKDIFCKGRRLNIQLPYDSYSVYKFENGWVRTLLYPLEKKGQDKEAIIELLLGDNPLKFFELTMGKEFADSIPRDDFGFPTAINMTYKQLYLQNYQAYHNINKESIYYRRNYILPAFIIQEKIENTNEIPIYDLGDSNFNKIFINNVYFKNKKIYEIPTLDLKEFIELYYQSKTPQKTFISEYEDFANDKINELSDEEIKDNSYQIMKNIKELLRGLAFYDVDTITIGSMVYGMVEQVILKCLQNEIQKLNECQDITYVQNLYGMIYPGYIELLKKVTNDEGKMMRETFKGVESFFIEKLAILKKHCINTEIGDYPQQKI